jgi:hypothetical protein
MDRLFQDEQDLPTELVLSRFPPPVHPEKACPSCEIALQGSIHTKHVSAVRGGTSVFGILLTGSTQTTLRNRSNAA